jgi:chromosome segregation ATPase
MFEKIKGLMDLKKEVEDITSALNDTKKALSSFTDEFTSVKKELNDVKNNQKEFLKVLKNDGEEIKNSKEELKKSVYDFNLLKNKLQNQIVEKFEEELKKELNINLEKLKKDIEQYNLMKSNIDAVVLKSKSVAAEIDKFVEISKNIKKEDFELTQFKREMLKSNNEKLELMQRIDTLEKLIAKMRRNQP